MLANDREKYESFWKEFGRQLKFGAYSDYGMHAELLRDLLLFWSAKEQKMVTLAGVRGQGHARRARSTIYYRRRRLRRGVWQSCPPLKRRASTRGYDVLLLTEDVDEFCLQIMRTYPRKDAEGKDGASRVQERQQRRSGP